MSQECWCVRPDTRDVVPHFEDPRAEGAPHPNACSMSNRLGLVSASDFPTLVKEGCDFPHNAFICDACTQWLKKWTKRSLCPRCRKLTDRIEEDTCPGPGRGAFVCRACIHNRKTATKNWKTAAEKAAAKAAAKAADPEKKGTGRPVLKDGDLRSRHGVGGLPTNSPVCRKTDCTGCPDHHHLNNAHIVFQAPVAIECLERVACKKCSQPTLRVETFKDSFLGNGDFHLKCQNCKAGEVIRPQLPLSAPHGLPEVADPAPPANSTRVLPPKEGSPRHGSVSRKEVHDLLQEHTALVPHHPLRRH